MRLLLTAALTLIMLTPAHAADAVLGERVAKLCLACHSLTDSSNKTGPSLQGVFGRAIASAEGFSYSQALKTFGAANGIWNEPALVTFLENPRDIVPGTTMTFAGLRKPADRENLVAYLKTLTP